jgi:hypothetical protein
LPVASRQSPESRKTKTRETMNRIPATGDRPPAPATGNGNRLLATGGNRLLATGNRGIADRA